VSYSQRRRRMLLRRAATAGSPRVMANRAHHYRLDEALVTFLIWKVHSHNVAVLAQHFQLFNLEWKWVGKAGTKSGKTPKSAEGAPAGGETAESSDCFSDRPRIQFLLFHGQSALASWRWFVLWEMERPCGGTRRRKPSTEPRKKNNPLHPRLVSLLLNGRPL